jgi:Flp pilus assembly pilin Flp
MDTILKLYAKMSTRVSTLRQGQSMTEYALILAAVAVAVYATYQTMGTDIKTMVGTVNTSLTAS